MVARRRPEERRPQDRRDGRARVERAGEHRLKRHHALVRPRADERHAVEDARGGERRRRERGVAPQLAQVEVLQQVELARRAPPGEEGDDPLPGACTSSCTMWAAHANDIRFSRSTSAQPSSPTAQSRAVMNVAIPWSSAVSTNVTRYHGPCASATSWPSAVLTSLSSTRSVAVNSRPASRSSKSGWPSSLPIHSSLIGASDASCAAAFSLMLPSSRRASPRGSGARPSCAARRGTPPRWARRSCRPSRRWGAVEDAEELALAALDELGRRRTCDWKQSGSVLSHGVLAWPGSDLAQSHTRDITTL